MSRKALLFVATVLTLSLAIYNPGVTAETSKVQIENEYIRIVVNTSEANMGRFSVGTTGGDPDRNTDQNKHLIYGGDDPWTSYTTVRIGNQNWVYGSPTDRRAGSNGLYGELVQPPTVIDGTIQSSWMLGPIQVWQILSITRSSTTGLLDTAQIEYHVENTDSVAHMVGTRLVLDTMLGANDGAPFRVDDRGLTTDTVYYAQNMPQFWQAFDSLANPQVMSQGTLTGPGVTTPDRVYFTNWGSLADQAWSFDFTPGRDFMRTGEFELDSAIAIFWDQSLLGPGESRSFVSHYGLGGVTIAPGDLVLGVTSPAQITADAEGVQTFSIIAYVQNAGSGEARDVVAKIKLPPGLELVGSRPEVRLGGLQVDETKQTGWTVRAHSNVDGVLSYEVEVMAINSKPNKVRRSVEVLSPAKLRVHFSGPPALSVQNEKYEPSVFEAKASVKNEGGTPAYGGTFEIMNPIGLDLVSGQNPKRFAGTIDPGEEVSFSWLLKPKGISGALPYSLSVSTASGKDVKSNLVIVPELKEKVWVGSPLSSRGAIRVGDYFSLSVWATNFRDFTGAELDVSFDPELLEIVGKTLGISRGTLFVDDVTAPLGSLSWPTVSNQTGQVIGFKGRREQPLQLSYGTLVTFQFLAKGAGETDIKIDGVKIMTSYGEVENFSIEHGKITIEP